MTKPPVVWWRRARLLHAALAVWCGWGIWLHGDSWGGVLNAFIVGSSGASFFFINLVIKLLSQQAELWAALEDTRDMTKAFRQAVETWPAELADSDVRPKTLN